MVFSGSRKPFGSILRANRDCILFLEKNEGDLKSFYLSGARDSFSSVSNF